MFSGPENERKSQKRMQAIELPEAVRALLAPAVCVAYGHWACGTDGHNKQAMKGLSNLNLSSLMLCTMRGLLDWP
jgi:hypothetical protein